MLDETAVETTWRIITPSGDGPCPPEMTDNGTYHSCARHRPAHRYSGHQGGSVGTRLLIEDPYSGKLLAPREVKAEPPRLPIGIRCQFLLRFR